MAIPLHGSVEIPLLIELAKLGGSATPRQMYDALAQHFQLTSHERFHLTTNDGEKRSLWENHVRQVRRTLVQNGEVSNAVRGRWMVTPEGYSRLHRSGYVFRFGDKYVAITEESK